MLAVVCFLFFIILVCLAVPITYIFLNLAGKIGPKDPGTAFVLGFALTWLAGLGIAFSFSTIMRLLKLH